MEYYEIKISHISWEGDDCFFEMVTASSAEEALEEVKEEYGENSGYDIQIDKAIKK